MNERQLKSREATARRLRWLILSRLGIAIFLFCVSYIVKIWGLVFLTDRALVQFNQGILAVSILSGFYLVLLHFNAIPRINVYVQALMDVLIVTWLVYITGGVQSNYAVLYPLIIIYTVLFLERNGGLVIASACAVSYGILLNFVFHGIITSPSEDILIVSQMSASYVFTRMFVHIASFYTIAFLASFVVARERETRNLLLERETAFDQLDQLHRSIIESVDVGIITVNLLGRVKSFNRAASAITGFSFGHVENRDIRKIFPQYNDIIKQIERGAKDTKGSVIEIKYNAQGRDERILECSISPLVDRQGTKIGSILIFQDVTIVKEMKEDYERNRRLAVVGEMAAGLAHEMRTPLASISGSIQVLSKGLKLGSSDERLMQIILRGKDQLENFMRDFLILARPSHGVSETFDIRDIIRDVLDTLHYMPDWMENISVSPDMHRKTLITANKTEIRQVVWNLLLNSIQAMPGGGTIEISTSKIKNGERNEWVELRIADTGSGITEESMDKVFEPFYTTKEKGTGLGLTVVSRIIEGSGGKITLESKPGKGTICIVILPVNASKRNISQVSNTTTSREV